MVVVVVFRVVAVVVVVVGSLEGGVVGLRVEEVEFKRVTELFPVTKVDPFTPEVALTVDVGSEA